MPHTSSLPHFLTPCSYFIWINKISYLTYAYTSLMQSELTGLMVADPNSPEGPWVEAETLMPKSISNGLSMQQNVGVLVAIWGGVEALQLGGFHLAHRLGML